MHHQLFRLCCWLFEMVCIGMAKNRLALLALHSQIVPQDKYWEVVMVTGQGSSASSHTGVSTLYTLDASSGKMVKRGTVDRVCSGNTYYRIGWPGQGPGKIARALSWNKVLGMNEIQNVATTLTTCKADGKLFLDFGRGSGNERLACPGHVLRLD